MVFDTSLDLLIDTTSAPVWTADSGGNSVSPDVTTGQLAGGGYFTAWAADINVDGLPDAIAVQRFTAQGNPDGTIIQLGQLPIKQLVGTEADLRDLFSFDALNGGGYVLTYRVPTPAVAFNWVLTGAASMAQGLAFAGKPAQFTVTGNVSGLSFSLHDNTGAVADVPLTKVLNPDGTTTITVSAANLATFGNVERVSLQLTGSATVGAPITIAGTGEENWRFFPDNVTATHNISGTAFAASPAPGAPNIAVLGDVTGRVQSFHVTSVTAAPSATVGYSIGVSTSAEVKAALGLFPGVQTSAVIDGLTYTLQPSGVVIISGASLIPDGSGNIAVPTAMLGALSYHDAQISLIAFNVASGSTFSGTATVITPTVVTEGLHAVVYDAAGVRSFDHVIDTSSAPEWISESDGTPANPHLITGNLADGGFYASWLTDSNHDGSPDAVAVQKYAANGTANGGVVQLGQLPLLQFAGSPDVAAHSYDIEVLGGGGFAMSYGIPAPTDRADYPSVVASTSGTVNLFFVGQPHSFTVGIGNTPLGSPVFTLRGVNASGQQISVPLTYTVNANLVTVAVSPDVLAQFANPERVSLAVTGLAANVSFSYHADLEPNWRYSGTEAMQTAHLVGTVQQIGVNPANLAPVYGAFLSTGSGRAETFHVGTVTAASSSPVYSMSIVTDNAGRSALGLFSPGQVVVHDGFTYQLQSSGVISVTGPFAPDGSGNIAVPTWALSSLGYHDAGITLAIGNLAQSSSFSGDVTYRTPTVVTEGIHTRVYDSSGVLQFDHAINTGAAHEWAVDANGELVNPNVSTGELAGGGYYTSWLADTDGDGLPDAIGVQRFDAAGAAVGGVVTLDGLPLKALAGSQMDGGLLYSFDALTGGGYTASINVPTPAADFHGTLGNGTGTTGSATFAYSNNLGLVGLPSSISVVSSNGSLAGLQFQLSGTNAQGQQVTVNLTMTGQNGSGTAVVSPADLAGFANPERVTFRITGMTAGQTVAVNGTVVQDQRYFSDQPVATSHVDFLAVSNGAPSPVYVGASGVAQGRPESFHIASAVAASTTPITYLLQVSGSTVLWQLGLLAGQKAVIDGFTYTMSANGVVNVSGLNPDANGNIAVPAALLNMLDYQDAGIALIAVGLAQGSTFSTDVTYRTPIIIDDGIFTRTYDSAGDITYMHATSGADKLFGGVDNETFTGLAGNDTLHGGLGNDSIDGGAGTDVATYDGARGSATVTVNAAAHTLAITTGLDGADTLQNVEQVKFADGLYSFTFANPGAAVVANFNPAFGWASQNQYPRHVADMNGDGYGDIVGFGTAGVLVSYGSAGGSFSGTAVVLADFGQNAGWANDNQFHRAVADVNGDGRADILGFGFAGTLVSLAKPDGTFTTVTTGLADFGVNQGWANQNGFARLVGDVNGDGKADIVGFGFAGALVALGNGNGTFQGVKTGIANFGVNQGWTSDTTFHRELADVNGDGRADLIGFGIAGTYVALSNGDGTFADAKLVLQDFGTNQGWSSNDSFSRLVTDVNGDHIGDIVGFGIAGTLVAFGKGDGTFTQAGFDVTNFGANQGWSSDNTFHREVADINHDGLADVVGFGIAGVLVGVNQGDFLI